MSPRLLVLDDDTAVLGEGVRVAALRAGADDVIGKPAPLARLRDAALRAMKKQ